MAKEIFHDIIPADKRSIRQIPLPEKRAERIKEETEEDKKNPIQRDITPPPPHIPHIRKSQNLPPERPKNSSHIISWSIVVIVIIGAYFGVSVYFAGATVNVTPKEDSISVNLSTTGTKDGSNNTLQFDVMTLTKDLASNPVTASSATEHIETKASGSITVYNNYDSNPQELVATTRFQSADGHIYRIASPITVPGKTGNTPGKVTAVIYADKAGADYNIPAGHFTIPGFQGGAKATGFYADSSGPMTGGFIGNTNEVDPAIASSTLNSLSLSLISTLQNEAATTKPNNYILYPDTGTTTFSQLPQTGSKTEVVLNERGIYYGVIFNKDALTKFILANSSSSLDDLNGATIDGLDTLNVTVSNLASIVGSSTPQIQITIHGAVKIISNVDTNKLKTDLAGLPKGNLANVLSKYDTIAKASATFRPFWRRSYPDASKITVELTK